MLSRSIVAISGFIGVREIFCQGGGKPFAQKILASVPKFTKEPKRNEGHIATT